MSALSRNQHGFLIPPWSMFPRASLRSRTVGFPESGSDRGFTLTAFPSEAKLKCWPMSTLSSHGLPVSLMPIFTGLVIPGSVSRTIQGPPRTQSPFARLRRYPFRRDVFRITSEGITPPSSLLRTHAPVQEPPFSFGSRLVKGSLQVVTSPCWLLDLPGVISADPSLGVWTRTPVVFHGALARFFPWTHRPSPSFKWIGFPTISSRKATSHGIFFSGLQSFRYVQTPRFARHPGRSCPSYSLCSCDFYFRASHDSLPHHAPDMLNVRIRQLTFGDSHPIRSAALPAAPKTF
jgi:hypothetical protein